MTFATIIDHIKTIEAAAPPVSRRPKRAKPAGIHLGVIAHVPSAGGYAFIRPDAPIEGVTPGDDIYIGAGALKRVGNLQKGDRVGFNTRNARKPGMVEAVDVGRAA